MLLRDKRCVTLTHLVGALLHILCTRYDYETTWHFVVVKVVRRFFSICFSPGRRDTRGDGWKEEGETVYFTDTILSGRRNACFSALIVPGILYDNKITYICRAHNRLFMLYTHYLLCAKNWYKIMSVKIVAYISPS